jgi:hypothetical protein
MSDHYKGGNMDRNETIKKIKTALQKRSGMEWSVTGGRGTAWGWIEIDAPPKRRTCHAVKKEGALTDCPEDYEEKDTGQLGGYMTVEDRIRLADLLGLSDVHFQGASIPASSAYYQEYVDRAEGRTPTVKGEPYWD